MSMVSVAAPTNRHSDKTDDAKQEGKHIGRFPLITGDDETFQLTSLASTHRRHVDIDEKGAREAPTTTSSSASPLPISPQGPPPEDTINFTNTELHEHKSQFDEYNKLRLARRYLYISHSLNQFSEWSWQFCLVIFFAALTHYESLLFVSTYGVTLNGMVAYLTPRMGQKIDQAAAKTAMVAASPRSGTVRHDDHPRLTLVQQWILLENSSVLLATVCCWYLFQAQQGSSYDDVIDENGNAEAPTTTFSFLNWLLQPQSASSRHWIITLSLLLAIHILGAMAQVLDKSVLVAMERDWIVMMSYSSCIIQDTSENPFEDATPILGDARITNAGTNSAIDTLEVNDEQWLTQTNVTMKQIDLSCQIAAPALAGWFIAYWTTSAIATTETIDDGSGINDPKLQGSGEDWSGAIVWVGSWNVLSLLVESVCIRRIYHLIPALSMPASTTAPTSTSSTSSQVGHMRADDEGVYCKVSIDDDEDEIRMLPSPEMSSHRNDKVSNDDEEDVLGGEQDGNPPNPDDRHGDSNADNGRSGFCHGLYAYFFLQPFTISLGGLGLALLYFNVLSFSGMMTAYLVSLGGMSLTTIGMWRGLSSAIGLLGTIAFDISVRRFGLSLQFTGLWSIVWEFICLTISAASLFWIETDPRQSMMWLIAGVLPSRVGLWVYDIAITQLMQQTVKPNIRGLIGGVQTSMNAWIELLPFGLGMIYSEPSQFVVFIIGGYLAVGLAMVMYIVGICIDHNKVQLGRDGPLHTSHKSVPNGGSDVLENKNSDGDVELV